MGVDYSATGGIGVKIELPYTEENHELLDGLLAGTPYCYSIYGNAYSGKRFLMVLMKDPLSGGWEGLPDKVRAMIRWLDDNGFPSDVEIISELYIY